jgi:hypothetical protein
MFRRHAGLMQSFAGAVQWQVHLGQWQRVHDPIRLLPYVGSKYI